jgi:hypothetical protein
MERQKLTQSNSTVELCFQFSRNTILPPMNVHYVSGENRKLAAHLRSRNNENERNFANNVESEKLFRPLKRCDLQSALE